ncbi:MAG: FG-GAP-like repeat-containing protein [Bacteroidota bacterium]
MLKIGKSIFCATFIVFCFAFSFSVQAQISFVNSNNSLNQTDFHSGLAVGVADVNNDGRDDIVHLDDGFMLFFEYQVQGATPFSSQAKGALDGDEESLWSVCVADVNHDGKADIVGGRQDGAGLLISTENDYTFIDLEGSAFLSQGVNFVDINMDGHLDIFACDDQQESRIWGNDGNGQFFAADDWIDMSTTPQSDNSGNYASIWTDFDNDGDLDLHLSKCRSGIIDPTDPRRINTLFVNDGNGQYTEMAETYGLKNGRQSLTADFQDIDNDGDLDCFVINHGEASQLFSNDGNGYFTDITATSGINVNLKAMQTALRDFDNDGYVDLLIAGQRHLFYHNNGDGTFTDLSDAIFDENDLESFAIGDLNHDGFLDIYGSYAHIYKEPSDIDDVLWLNAGNENHFLGVHLQGVVSNLQGIGSRVEIYGEWGVQIREIRSGEGYGISNSLNAHFGLNQSTNVDSLIIRWPSGIVDKYENLAPQQYLTFIEGTCIAPSFEFAPIEKSSFCADELIDLSLSGPQGFDYLWSTQEVSQNIEIQAPGLYRLTISDGNNCSGVSPTLFIDQKPALPIPTLIDIEYLGGNGDTAMITVDAQNAVWYDAPEGGNLIGIGNVFHYETTSDPTLLYVAAEEAYPNEELLCSSERLAIDLSTTSATDLASISSIQSYPNPVKDQLELRIEANASQQLFLQLINCYGQSILAQQHYLSTGLNQMALEVEQFPPGIYYLQFRVQQQSLIKKIIIH